MWAGIKTIINTKGIKDTIPNSIKINNIETSDDQIIASAFNNYFCNIAENLKNSKNLILCPTTEKEIKDIIHQH